MISFLKLTDGAGGDGCVQETAAMIPDSNMAAINNLFLLLLITEHIGDMAC